MMWGETTLIGTDWRKSEHSTYNGNCLEAADRTVREDYSRGPRG